VNRCRAGSGIAKLLQAGIDRVLLAAARLFVHGLPQESKSALTPQRPTRVSMYFFASSPIAGTTATTCGNALRSNVTVDGLTWRRFCPGGI
jgi:hypothetical protein